MFRRLLLLLVVSIFFKQKGLSQSIPLKTGDLLFLDLDCGSLCDAIEAVTKGYNHQPFSHVGLVWSNADSIYVIEAIGKSVRLTLLSQFLLHSSKNATVGRLNSDYQTLIPKAVDFAVRQKGIPYDDQFLYNNGKYYCSELIYDAFKHANGGKPFFKLEPMTYKMPGSTDFFPAWKEYFSRLQMEIPEGKPGCNPGGLSRSEKITIIGTYP